jgi:hypothetical protein
VDVKTLVISSSIGLAIVTLVGYQYLPLKRSADAQAATQYVQEVTQGKHDGLMADGHTLCIEGLDKGCKALPETRKVVAHKTPSYGRVRFPAPQSVIAR